MRISDWSSDVCSSDLLALRMRWQLIVQATQHPTRGTRMVVLHELNRTTHSFVKFLLIKTFEEKTARIAKHRRLDDFYVADGCIQNFHARRSEEHASELQSLISNSYAVFCLK